VGSLNSKKKTKKKEFMNGRFIVFDVGGKKHKHPKVNERAKEKGLDETISWRLYIGTMNMRINET